MGKFKVFGTIAIVGILALGYGYRWSMTSEVSDTFVRDSERVCSTSGCKYVAFGANETYENTDTWYFLKFNSSDVEKNLTKGTTCSLKVYGIRFPFFSWYRNIITADCEPLKT